MSRHRGLATRISRNDLESLRLKVRIECEYGIEAELTHDLKANAVNQAKVSQASRQEDVKRSFVIGSIDPMYLDDAWKVSLELAYRAEP